MDNILKLMNEYIKHEKIEELESIKAEIKDMEDSDCNFSGFYRCQNETLEIIDKHINKLKED